MKRFKDHINIEAISIITSCLCLLTGQQIHVCQSLVTSHFKNLAFTGSFLGLRVGSRDSFSDPITFLSLIQLIEILIYISNFFELE